MHSLPSPLLLPLSLPPLGGLVRRAISPRSCPWGVARPRARRSPARSSRGCGRTHPNLRADRRPSAAIVDPHGERDGAAAAAQGDPKDGARREPRVEDADDAAAAGEDGGDVGRSRPGMGGGQ